MTLAVKDMRQIHHDVLRACGTADDLGVAKAVVLKGVLPCDYFTTRHEQTAGQ